jgi:hypothetical protein
MVSGDIHRIGSASVPYMTGNNRVQGARQM